MAKGLMAEVFRWSLGDCTNDGVSKHFNSLVIADTAPVFEANALRPAVYLHEWKGELIAIPERIDIGRGLGGWMFGGNFLYSSDSRFPSKHPIKIYDRREY